MKKFIPRWYDLESVKKEDPPILAETREEAERKAYMAYDGNPPAPMLSLEEVK